MRSLPLAARCYLIVIWSIAAILIALVLFHSPPSLDQIPLLFLWFTLFVLADYFESIFEIAGGNRAAMTITDTVIVFLVAVSGGAGVIVTALGTGIVGVLHQHLWYRNLFNTAQRSITYLAMLLVYVVFQVPGALPFSGFQGLITLVILTGIGYVITPLLVSAAIGFATRQPFLQVYQASFQRVRWVQFITLPLGAILAVLWTIDPWLLLPGILPLIMAQRAFQAVADAQAESRRSRALADELQQLNVALDTRVVERTAALHTAHAELARLQFVRTREIEAAAHDLRAHLNDIQAAADLLAGAAEVAHAPPVLLGRSKASMYAAIDAQNTLLEDLLLAASLRQGRLDLRPQCAELPALVARVAQRLDGRFRKQGCALTVTIDGELPPAWCDPPRVERVLHNVVDNALRYAVATPLDSVVQITLSTEAEQVICRVSDNGPGIAPVDLERLNERFARAACGDPLPEGAGLGLDFCARLMALHGGSLDITSPGLGGGATVSLRLPRAKAGGERAVLPPVASPVEEVS